MSGSEQEGFVRRPPTARRDDFSRKAGRPARRPDPLILWLKFRAGGAIITSEKKEKKKGKREKGGKRKRKEKRGGTVCAILLFCAVGHHGHYPSPSPCVVAPLSVVPQRGNYQRSILGVWLYARRNWIGELADPSARAGGRMCRAAVGGRLADENRQIDSGLFPPPSRRRYRHSLFLTIISLSI